MNYEYSFEKIQENTVQNDCIIDLDELNDSEKEEINPLIPPTSGIRMQIFKVEGNKYTLTKKHLMNFLRVMKAIAVVGKKELQKNSPSVLIVADDRPSADILIEYASRIFTFEGYKIYHQNGEGTSVAGTSYIRGKSRMSAPYASASVALIKDLDIILMLTASHNELLWNGLKFYISRPIPISGGVMKAVSEYAINLKKISLSKSYNATLIDAEKINNEYIKNIVSKIIDCNVLRGKKVILWPFLGVAPEIISLLESYGAKVKIIEDSRNPPDPTIGVDEEKLKSLMLKEDVKISILLDADRDRLVFLIKSKKGYIKLSSNELYTSMMNILKLKLGKKYINIRTIPSDPRCDNEAVLNLITGVGYKHLGMIQYMIADRDVPESQLQSAILYLLRNNEFVQIKNHEDSKKIIQDYDLSGEIISVLWEESGGHTFNIMKAEKIGKKTILRTDYPLIGDKYPAVAILVLCSILEMGIDLIDYIDENIKASRTTIEASDEEKIKYVNYFSQRTGSQIAINEVIYNIGAFSDNSGEISIIYLKSKDSMLYVRPSGTGPEIRIYIFGNKNTYEKELKVVAQFLKTLSLNK